MMAPLPGKFSLAAVHIKSALLEGRDADARRMLAEILRAGKADAVVQGIAADLLLPQKRARGRRSTLPQHWLEIAEYFEERRSEGARYEDALREAAKHFGYSESHVRTCLATYERALEAGQGR